MNEADWLKCDDPMRMLEHVGPTASARKLRLFACGCCRLVWDLLSDPASRRAVELAEQFADGQAAEKEVRRARSQAMAATGPATMIAYWTLKEITLGVLEVVIEGGVNAIARSAGNNARNSRESRMDQIAAYEAAAQSMLLEQTQLVRELFDNPFHTRKVEPAWLAWNGGAVSRFARSVSDAGRFDELPLLADALEEAGCADAELLGHCRLSAGHVRGCWALDLVLERS